MINLRCDKQRVLGFLCYNFCLLFFASHGGTETTEMAVAFGLRFWLCERSPSSTLRVSLPGAARPAVVSPHQASLVVDTTLDLDDGLSMDSKGAFSVWVIFGEKRLVLMCCRIARTVPTY